MMLQRECNSCVDRLPEALLRLLCPLPQLGRYSRFIIDIAPLRIRFELLVVVPITSRTLNAIRRNISSVVGATGFEPLLPKQIPLSHGKFDYERGQKRPLPLMSNLTRGAYQPSLVKFELASDLNSISKGSSQFDTQ